MTSFTNSIDDTRLTGKGQGQTMSSRTRRFSCWVLAGTLCSGQVQGTFAQKYKNCELCDFYKNVKQEEFPQFQLSALLLAKLKN